MKNPMARVGQNDGPWVAEMYNELKEEIDNYVKEHKKQMEVAPTITEPFTTRELQYIKPEDIQQARAHYRVQLCLGQPEESSPADAE